MLEEIGIPITTERGPFGGYELVGGYKLPPMMFTYDEVLALSLGLAAVRGLGVTDAAHAIAGAQAKLERVIPVSMKNRMRSVGESVNFDPFNQSSSGCNSSLAILSAAAHGRQGVRMRYQARSGQESERDFDPYGLAFSAGRWYTVGFCHMREGLRSFRLDRVGRVTPQSRQFVKPPKFDVVRHLTTSIATLPRKFTIEVMLQTDMESAGRELFQAIGVLEPVDGMVLLRAQADDLDWFARELARLPWPFEIRLPKELIVAVTRHAEKLLSHHHRLG